jgi:hypothetical protein
VSFFISAPIAGAFHFRRKTMNDKFKSLLVAADEKRKQWELAAMLGDSVSAKVLKQELQDLEGQALCLMRKHLGLL